MVGAKPSELRLVRFEDRLNVIGLYSMLGLETSVVSLKAQAVAMATAARQW